MNRIEAGLLPGSGADGYLRRAVRGTIVGYLIAGSLANPADGYLRRWSHAISVPGAGGPFPTQFAGLRTFYGAVVRELCLVASADGATGMGGIPRIDKNATTYAVYLVETSDPDASSVRVQTGAGTKSVRLKT